MIKFVPLNKTFALSHMHKTVFAFTFEKSKSSSSQWIKTTERPLPLTICGFTNNANYDITPTALSTTTAQKYIVLQKKDNNNIPYVVRNTGTLDRQAYRLYVVANVAFVTDV